MTSELVEGPVRSIFLSHAHEDKPFVKRLARDLASQGVRVWVDEAEMGVGDSLLEKITSSVREMDYLAAVISEHSAQSKWVRRELKIAMTQDIAGLRVKVLPLLLRGGQVPAVLKGKIVADFTSEITYDKSLSQLLVRLGIKPAEPDPTSDRLSELASSSPLLRLALDGLRAGGIANATADALLASPNIADVHLSEFFSLIARELQGRAMFELAVSLPRFIDERGVGHEALDWCLNSGLLGEDQLKRIATNMLDLKTDVAVRWCHERLVSIIKNDSYYNSFLVRHVETVVEQCYDDMAAYLLGTDRGPGHYRVDSLSLVISHVANPWPFQHRWIEWIRNGYFEHRALEGRESAELLYRILNQHWGDAKFQCIVDEIEAYVLYLIKCESQPNSTYALYHLVAMVAACYRGADRIVDQHVWFFPFPRTVDIQRILEAIKTALRAVVEYNLDPEDKERKRLQEDSYLKMAQADSGITGFWVGNMAQTEKTPK